MESGERTEAVVEKLVATTKWGRELARLAVRANFCCEYCGLDFLLTPDNYKLFHVDHIVPLSGGGKIADFDNLAAACNPCNFSFKRRYDPRTKAGENANRQDLINAAWEHIKQKKKNTDQELNTLRAIVRRPSSQP
jgi:5-methylcytosine-specific restriction endonuclease McrA